MKFRIRGARFIVASVTAVGLLVFVDIFTRPQQPKEFELAPSEILKEQRDLLGEPPFPMTMSQESTVSIWRTQDSGAFRLKVVENGQVVRDFSTPYCPLAPEMHGPTNNASFLIGRYGEFVPHVINCETSTKLFRLDSLPPTTVATHSLDWDSTGESLLYIHTGKDGKTPYIVSNISTCSDIAIAKLPSQLWNSKFAWIDSESIAAVTNNRVKVIHVSGTEKVARLNVECELHEIANDPLMHGTDKILASLRLDEDERFGIYTINLKSGEVDGLIKDPAADLFNPHCLSGDQLLVERVKSGVTEIARYSK